MFRCVALSVLIYLASSKDVWDFSFLREGGWCPCFSRPLNDWEMGSVERFLSWLDGLRVHRDEEDKVPWIETKNGKFTMKSLYTALESGTSVSFPWSNIWKAWVQHRVNFFAWEVTWGKILTLDQVQKRGWPLANRCLLCHVEEEFIGHLLVRCAKTRILWELLFTLFGVYRVLPLLVRETLLGWHGSFVNKKCRKVWRAGPLCLF